MATDFPSSSSMVTISKSFASCAGVIFTAPVPNSRSTMSSATTGIGRFISGNRKVVPASPAYRSSFGLTATAVSPSIVSGRVVATTTPCSPDIPGYRMYQSVPFFST